MPATIRFTLTRQALVKIRDNDFCKFRIGDQEYQIVLDDDTTVNDVIGIFAEDEDYDYETGEDVEPKETDENLDEDTTVDEPGVEMPKDEWKKDVS